MSFAIKIDAIVDRGALIVSINDKYAGKINSYNNIFSKIFAKLFRLSIDKKIGDKKYCLSKKSYTDHLKSHLTETENDIDISKDYASVWSESSLKMIRLTEKVWPHLSKTFKKKLFTNINVFIEKKQYKEAVSTLPKGIEWSEIEVGLNSRYLIIAKVLFSSFDAIADNREKFNNCETLAKLTLPNDQSFWIQKINNSYLAYTENLTPIGEPEEKQVALLESLIDIKPDEVDEKFLTTMNNLSEMANETPKLENEIRDKGWEDSFTFTLYKDPVVSESYDSAGGIIPQFYEREVIVKWITEEIEEKDEKGESSGLSQRNTGFHNDVLTVDRLNPQDQPDLLVHLAKLKRNMFYFAQTYLKDNTSST